MDKLTINHRDIPFEMRRSKRSNKMILTIDSKKQKVVLTVPRFTMNFQVNSFLRQQEEWIDRHWSELEKVLAGRPKLEHSIQYYKNKSKVLIRDRLAYFNDFYNFDFNRVFFRDQKTRWGSCSSERNLNFNWRLVLAPLEILDYVVVHELCHLKQMNHSPKFWQLVSEQIPDYKKRRKWLKENHYLLTL